MAETLLRDKKWWGWRLETENLLSMMAVVIFMIALSPFILIWMVYRWIKHN